MYTKTGVLLNGKLIRNDFDSNITAGQWAYGQGYNPNEFKTVLLLPNGEINHRAIIQVFDFRSGKYVLENHYTTCGTFHHPMNKFEEDKNFFLNKYCDSRYKVDAWTEY